MLHWVGGPVCHTQCSKLLVETGYHGFGTMEVVDESALVAVVHPCRCYCSINSLIHTNGTPYLMLLHQTLRAQDSVNRAQILVLLLLIVEGAGVCFGSVIGLLFVLRSLMAHRASLCSVFLALPNIALRTLANKSTNIGDEDEDSDDGEL